MAKKPSLDSLVNRAFQVKPIIEGPDGKLHWLDPQDLFRDNLMSEMQTRGEAQQLKEIGTFTVEIPVGLRQFPQPTQAQILPEIPKDLMKNAVAYQVNFHGSFSGEDFSIPATVTVYSGPVPADIKVQPVYAKGKPYRQRAKPAKKPKPAQVFNEAAVIPVQQDIEAPAAATFKKPVPPAPVAPPAAV